MITRPVPAETEHEEEEKKDDVIEWKNKLQKPFTAATESMSQKTDDSP